jgi:phosphopantothenoylcysteine decarboxylase/phosphopantothenate--cysteine ligase
MNVNMLTHPATCENIAKLKERGVIIVEPEEGELACGWVGSGRLADPQEIFFAVRRALSVADYAGKKVLISTGPTREAIDPVRFISNRSSGKMGVALAHEAYRRGADVTVVHGPMRAVLSQTIRAVPITSAQEMAEAMFERWESADIVIMVAAVADFMPGQICTEKIKRADKDKIGELTKIELVENIDILATIAERRGNRLTPTLVGFAVETGDLDDMLDELERKLKRKGADLIVGNFAEEAFDVDTNRVWMVNRNGKREEVASTFKWRVANRILDATLKL